MFKQRWEEVQALSPPNVQLTLDPTTMFRAPAVSIGLSDISSHEKRFPPLLHDLFRPQSTSNTYLCAIRSSDILGNLKPQGSNKRKAAKPSYESMRSTIAKKLAEADARRLKKSRKTLPYSNELKLKDGSLAGTRGHTEEETRAAKGLVGLKGEREKLCVEGWLVCQWSDY